MSSCILSSTTVFSKYPKCATLRRRFCHASSASPPHQQLQLQLHLQKLGKSLIPSVVVLESYFSSPSNSFDIHNWPRIGTGFFVEPALIVTSMHVVGRAAASYDSIRHKAYIARTIAFTHEGLALDTRPLAVNFARDLAVLEVVPPAPPRRGCTLAESATDRDSVLVAIARHQSLGLAMMVGNVRAAAGERSISRATATAPWPLDDDVGWVEHGWCGIGVSDPAPGNSKLCEASVTRIMGSPWFNLAGEVVGVSSWQVTDKSDEFSVGFAAPAASIRAVVDYAKTKGGDDPLVMDTWIGAHLIYGDC